jgi:hypothetical protein
MHIQLMQTFLAEAQARLRADFSALADRKYFESSVRVGELLNDFLTCVDSSLSNPLDFVQLSAIVENLRAVLLTNQIDPAEAWYRPFRMRPLVLILRNLSRSCFFQQKRFRDSMAMLRTALELLTNPPPDVSESVSKYVSTFTGIAGLLPKAQEQDWNILDLSDSDFETVLNQVLPIWKRLLTLRNQISSSVKVSKARRSLDKYIGAAGNVLTSFTVLRHFRSTLPSEQLLTEHFDFEVKCSSLWDGDFEILVTRLSLLQDDADLINNTTWFLDFFGKIREVACLSPFEVFQKHLCQRPSFPELMNLLAKAELRPNVTARGLFARIFTPQYVKEIQKVAVGVGRLSSAALRGILKLFDRVEKSIESELGPILSISLDRLKSIPAEFRQPVWRCPGDYRTVEEQNGSRPGICWAFLAATSSVPEDVDSHLDVLWLRETLLGRGVPNCAVRLMIDETVFQTKATRVFRDAHRTLSSIPVDKTMVLSTVKSMIDDPNIAAPFRLIVIVNHGHRGSIDRHSQLQRGNITVFDRDDLVALLTELNKSYEEDQEGHCLVVLVTC